MRIAAGIAGAIFTAAGVYMLAVALFTSGTGIAGTFFGFFGLLGAGIGLPLLYHSFKS
jgi:uncharacterized membrane protein